MSFDNIKYIDTFPHSFSPNGDKQVIDVIGVRNFLIYDSIMIMSTINKDSLWVIASMPDFQIKGSMLKIGQGPNELTVPPSVAYNTKITEVNNKLFAYIYEPYKGELLKLDIISGIGTTNMDISLLVDSLPKSLFNFVVINDSTYLCKEARNNHTQQIRYVYNNKNKSKQFPVLERLNNITINRDEDINILSTITKHNSTNDIIIEMPIGLNYINMYSLDNSYAKTICIGKTLNDIEKIQSNNRWDRMYTFADLRLFEDFWGVLFINETEKDYQIKRKNFPKILLFDWEGSPLAEIKLNQLATSFDIDVHAGMLYSFDVETELFFKYDIEIVYN